jgi:ABC-type antimicrobial peptide transport system ATPase subunit
MKPDLLYVSWGGTGRAASVRKAMRRAMAEDRSLRYLAVLDDEHFADLDRSMLDIVADELNWMLDAQLELTKSQVGADQLEVSVDVVTGEVVELVVASVAESGDTDILIGAPVPVAGHDSIDSMIGQIIERTGCRVEVVQPDAS